MSRTMPGDRTSARRSTFTSRSEQRLDAERRRLEEAALAKRAQRAPKVHTTAHITAGGRPEGRTHSPVMVLLVLVSTLGILLYGQFLLNPANRGDLLPYCMVIAAEAIVVIQALLSM